MRKFLKDFAGSNFKQETGQFLWYKGWPKITEQTRIVDRQCPLSTSGKSTRISWFISFPMSARQHRSAEWWVRYRHVRSPLSRPLQRAPTPHTPISSQFLALRFCKSIHVGCAVCRKNSDSQLIVFLENSGDSIDLGYHHNCSRGIAPQWDKSFI